MVRPVKRVTVRLKGLDDSVKSDDIVDAICRITNCPGQAFHVGEIRQGYGKLGVTYARLPADAAKVLLDAGSWGELD